MADEEDWESEEFTVPTFVPPPVKSGWDDEDVPEEVVTPVSKPSAAQLAANAKKIADEEAALEAKIKNAKLANETAEEKKLRERKQAEDSEVALASEFLGGGKSVGSSSEGGSTVKGLGAIALKTKQDHLTFGTTVAAKLSQSSAFNIAAFYKTLSKTLDNAVVTSEVLDEILAEINKIREAKAKVEKANKTTVVKKSKKEIATATKKHNDKYGGSDYVDKYDHYNDLEDDFM